MLAVAGRDQPGLTLCSRTASCIAPDYSGTVYLEYTHAVEGGWDMDAYTGYTFRDESTTVISNEFRAINMPRTYALQVRKNF